MLSACHLHSDAEVEQRTIRQTSEIKFLNHLVEKHGLAEALISCSGRTIYTTSYNNTTLYNIAQHCKHDNPSAWQYLAIAPQQQRLTRKAPCSSLRNWHALRTWYSALLLRYSFVFRCLKGRDSCQCFLRYIRLVAYLKPVEAGWKYHHIGFNSWNFPSAGIATLATRAPWPFQTRRQDLWPRGRVAWDPALQLGVGLSWRRKQSFRDPPKVVIWHVYFAMTSSMMISRCSLWSSINFWHLGRILF